MRYVLDYYFSNMLIIILFNLISIGSALYLILVVFSKETASNTKFKIILGACAAMLIIFQITAHNHYGYVRKVKTILESDGYITLLDVKESEDTADFHRVYVLDKGTGKLINRFSAGNYYELLIQKENMVFVRHKNVYLIQNVLNGKIIKRYDPASLSRNHPEITHGVEEVSYDKKYSDYLEMKGKDGNLYYAEIFSGQLQQAETVAALRADNIGEKNAAETTDPALFTLDSKPGTHKIRQLKFFDSNRAQSNFPEFIEPVFLHIYPELRRLVILSYESTDKNEYILSCFDFDLQQVWTIKQKEENLKRNNVPGARFDTSVKVTGDLIYNCGAFVYSISVVDGYEKWRVKL